MTIVHKFFYAFIELSELAFLIRVDLSIPNLLMRILRINFNKPIVYYFLMKWHRYYGYYEPHLFNYIYNKFYLKKKYKIQFCENYEIRYNEVYEVRKYYKYVYIVSVLLHEKIIFFFLKNLRIAEFTIMFRVLRALHNVWVILHYINKILGALFNDLRFYMSRFYFIDGAVFIITYFGYYSLNTCDYFFDRLKYTLTYDYSYKRVLNRTLKKYAIPFIKKVFNTYAYCPYFWYKTILLFVVLPRVLKWFYAFVIASNIFAFHPNIELYYNTHIWGNVYDIFFKRIDHSFFEHLPQRTLNLYDMQSSYIIEKSLDLRLHFEHLWFQSYLFFETDYYQDYDTHAAIRLYIKFSSFFTSHVAYWNVYTSVLYIHSSCFYFVTFFINKVVTLCLFIVTFIDFYIDMPYIHFIVGGYEIYNNYNLDIDYIFYYMPRQLYYYSYNSFTVFKYLFNINSDLLITFNQVAYLSYWGEFSKEDGAVPFDWFFFPEFGPRDFANTSLLASYPIEINLIITNINTVDCINVHWDLLVLAKHLVNSSLQILFFIKSW